jgi:hypothetical protein
MLLKNLVDKKRRDVKKDLVKKYMRKCLASMAITDGLLLVSIMLWVEPRATNMLSKYLTTELLPPNEIFKGNVFIFLPN